MKRIVSAVLAFCLLAGVSHAGLTGTFSTGPGDSGLMSGGQSWSAVGDDPESKYEGLQVEWVVSQNTDGSWHYKYIFTNEAGEPLSMDVSHFIITISENADVYNLGADVEEIEIETFGEHESNPGFPAGETIYGVKINLWNDQTVAEFDSHHAPMWGDFYAKGGGNPKNYAYNIDLGVAVMNVNDYAADAALGTDGSELYKILVPDTVPEPATLVILGVGGILGLRKRRLR